MPLGWYRGNLGPSDIMLDGGPSSSGNGAQQPPPLLAHVYCGQTAEWIRIQDAT